MAKAVELWSAEATRTRLPLQPARLRRAAERLEPVPAYDRALPRDCGAARGSGSDPATRKPLRERLLPDTETRPTALKSSFRKTQTSWQRKKNRLQRKNSRLQRKKECFRPKKKYFRGKRESFARKKNRLRWKNSRLRSKNSRLRRKDEFFRCKRFSLRCRRFFRGCQRTFLCCRRAGCVCREGGFRWKGSGLIRERGCFAWGEWHRLTRRRRWPVQGARLRRGSRRSLGFARDDTGGRGGDASQGATRVELRRSSHFETLRRLRGSG